MSETDIKRALIAERGNVVRAAARLLRNEVKASVGVTRTADGKFSFDVTVFELDKQDPRSAEWVGDKTIILPTASPTGEEVGNAIEEMLIREDWLDLDNEYFRTEINFREQTPPYRLISKSGHFGPVFPSGFESFSAFIGNILDVERDISAPSGRGDRLS
jgi:hypothetical protein